MELPPPWEIRESQHYPGRCFYYNKVTQEATWIRPIPYPGNHIPWPPTIYVLQILIKHNQLPNPMSFKGPVTRTPEEARQLVKKIIDEIAFGEKSFEQLAEVYSDDPTADVGWIRKEDKPQYAETAWQLRIGEMSPAISSEDGTYIVLRRG